MAFSVSPSVIVREVDASASVPAIATPPAAMAGVFRWGPVGEVVLVSSENELVSRFGTPSADNYETFFVGADYLSYANALYVARVDNGAATASSTDKQELVVIQYSKQHLKQLILTQQVLHSKSYHQTK